MKLDFHSHKDTDPPLTTHAAPSAVSTQPKVCGVITPAHDAMGLAHRVDAFIESLEKGRIPHPSFEVNIDGRGFPHIKANSSGTQALILLKARAATLQDQYPSQDYSPRFKLFCKVAKGLDLQYLHDGDIIGSFAIAEHVADRLSALILTIKTRAQSASFKAKLKRHTKASSKNYRGACYLVDHLFKKFKRGVRVIRLDLGYKRKTELCEFDSPLTTAEIFAHRADFIAALPGLIHHDALAAYIWKTEFKPAKGFHHHLLIFLDAGKVRQDVTIARLLGEHWQKVITDERGLYQNINAEYQDKQHEPTTYVGLIRGYDAQRIESLKLIGVDYLCKHDYLIRWVMPDGHRAFGKTEVKQPE